MLHNSSRSTGLVLNKLLKIFGLGGAGHIIFGSKNSANISVKQEEPIGVERYNF